MDKVIEQLMPSLIQAAITIIALVVAIAVTWLRGLQKRVELAAQAGVAVVEARTTPREDLDSAQKKHAADSFAAALLAKPVTAKLADAVQTAWEKHDEIERARSTVPDEPMFPADDEPPPAA